MKYPDDFSDRTFIIAEIGNNHNGCAKTAIELVDAAAQCGVDAVKFQTFRGIDIVTPLVLSSEYPEWKVDGFTRWIDFLDSIALPLDAHAEVMAHARKKGLIFFSTPTSSQTVDFLEELDVPLYKIASMDVTNPALLEKVSRTGKPVIMSTGMANEQEIAKAANFFDKYKLSLMHCVSEYPLEFKNARLNRIRLLAQRFGCPVGFSDHSLESDLSLATVAMGAKIIEKHFTLSRNSEKKAEHHFALEPREMKELTAKIRKLETALACGSIDISQKESAIKDKYRRTLHVNKSMEQGEGIRENDIAILRPGDGAAPEDFFLYVGKKLSRNKNAWAPLTEDDV